MSAMMSFHTEKCYHLVCAHATPVGIMQQRLPVLDPQYICTCVNRLNMTLVGTNSCQRIEHL